MNWKRVKRCNEKTYLKGIEKKNRKFKRKVKQKQNKINLLEYKKINNKIKVINFLIKKIINKKINIIKKNSKELTEIEFKKDNNW